MVVQSLDVIRFGDFEVNLRTSELRKQGMRIRLAGQSFQVLRMLLARPGDVVTREDLKQELWPKDSFGDFDRGLNAAVNRLRDALGDSAESPHFIGTEPRRGYRFICMVEAKPAIGETAVDTIRTDGRNSQYLNESASSSPVPKLVTNQRRSADKERGRRNLRVALSLIAVPLLVVVALVLILIFAKPPIPPTELPLTTLPGKAGLPSFSPDGEQFVFVWDKKDGHPAQLFVQSVHGSPEAVQLTHLEDSWLYVPPAWSPDGRWIAYERYNPKWEGSERVFEIVLIPAPMGGHEVVVDRLGDCCDGLSWSPDSKFLVYHDKENPQDPVSIFMLDRDTLQRRQLTTPPKGTSQFLGDVNPVFNGDGSRIAFWRMPIVGINEILVLNLHTGTVQTIVHESSSPPEFGALAWDVTGKSLIYVSDRSGIKRLWRVAESGGEPEPLMVGDDASSVAISDRGHRLAFTRPLRDLNIWKIGIDPSGTETRTTIAVSSRQEMLPVLSPDETKIVFASDRSGFEEIWMSNSDGSHVVQLTHLDTHATGSPMWSPDSQRIAFASRAAGQGDIYVIGLDEANPKRITSDGFDNADPVWSSDGKWVYYTTNRLGQHQIFRVPSGGGTPSQVTLQGGEWPLRADDQRMYYLKPGTFLAQVWQKSLPDGEETRVAGSLEIPSAMNAQVTDAGVYFTGGDGAQHLRFFDFSTKQIRELSQLGARLAPGLSVSKDGRSILYSQEDSASSNILLVENFRRRTWFEFLQALVHSALTQN